MRAFEYVSATNRSQAMKLLDTAWGTSEILAGGTDLLALMKDDIVTPRRVVNIKAISDLRGVSVSTAGTRIGALSTLAELAEHSTLRQNYPAFVEALHEVASPQIRNLATLGGNLCQRPRCWYFRNRLGLLPRDGNGEDRVELGDNRYHAILGNDGAAKFVSPSTIVPVLIAYGAQVRLESPRGKRELALEKFFVAPRCESQREHDLGSDEMVTEVFLPPPSKVKAAHYEIRQKDAFDWPLAVAAVGLHMAGPTCTAARIVLGYVAPVPWRSGEAEKVLTGKEISQETAEAAAFEALKNARPLSQNRYKVQLARVALKRAILKAAGDRA